VKTVARAVAAVIVATTRLADAEDARNRHIRSLYQSWTATQISLLPYGLSTFRVKQLVHTAKTGTAIKTVPDAAAVSAETRAARRITAETTVAANTAHSALVDLGNAILAARADRVSSSTLIERIPGLTKYMVGRAVRAATSNR